ncbi:hypothetical protein ABW20_dc0104423 [Dactylellina cionopaga]|nr:hypothetical protein ABW20_dc0104423 [Dactylellina cionopaga]
MVYTLPLCVIFRLPNLTLRKKISVSILFVLGFFCLFLTAFNMVLSSSLFGVRLAIVGDPMKTIVFWPLEPAWAILVICLPAFRVLVDNGIKRIRSPSLGSEGSTAAIEISMVTVVSQKSVGEVGRTSIEGKRLSIQTSLPVKLPPERYPA